MLIWQRSSRFGWSWDAGPNTRLLSTEKWPGSRQGYLISLLRIQHWWWIRQSSRQSLFRRSVLPSNPKTEHTTWVLSRDSVGLLLQQRNTLRHGPNQQNLSRQWTEWSRFGGEGYEGIIAHISHCQLPSKGQRACLQDCCSWSGSLSPLPCRLRAQQHYRRRWLQCAWCNWLGARMLRALGTYLFSMDIVSRASFLQSNGQISRYLGSRLNVLDRAVIVMHRLHRPVGVGARYRDAVVVLRQEKGLKARSSLSLLDTDVKHHLSHAFSIGSSFSRSSRFQLIQPSDLNRSEHVSPFYWFNPPNTLIGPDFYQKSRVSFLLPIDRISFHFSRPLNNLFASVRRLSDRRLSLLYPHYRQFTSAFQPCC